MQREGKTRKKTLTIILQWLVMEERLGRNKGVARHSYCAVLRQRLWCGSFYMAATIPLSFRGGFRVPRQRPWQHLSEKRGEPPPHAQGRVFY